jgi:hypothetical protein
MKLSAYVAVCLAAVSAGLIAFWNVRDGSMSASTDASGVTQSAVPLSERVESTTIDTDESVTSRQEQLERSLSEQATESRLAARQQDMEDGIYELLGSGTVEYFIASGLSRPDSEEIARRLAADTAECTMDAVRVEAEKQSTSVDEVLSQLGAVVRGGGDPFDMANLSSVQASAFPCQADAMQRAGIPYPSGVSEEEIERLQECIVRLNDTDIVDSGVILEICESEVFGEVP